MEHGCCLDMRVELGVDDVRLRDLVISQVSSRAELCLRTVGLGHEPSRPLGLEQLLQYARRVLELHPPSDRLAAVVQLLLEGEGNARAGGALRGGAGLMDLSEELPAVLFDYPSIEVEILGEHGVRLGQLLVQGDELPLLRCLYFQLLDGLLVRHRRAVWKVVRRGVALRLPA